MFDWLTKPKLMMSFLDYITMYLEFVLAAFIVFAALVLFEQYKRIKIIEKHGKSCKCRTCMGLK